MDALLAGPPGPLVPTEADGAAAALLGEPRCRAAEAEAAGARDPAARASRAPSASTPVDVELLLVALAPDLDPRFERLYGYLHDDVSRRRASVGPRARAVRRGRRPADAAATGPGSGPLAPLVAGGLAPRRGRRPADR